MLDPRTETDLAALQIMLGMPAGLISDNILITNSTKEPPSGGGEEPPSGGDEEKPPTGTIGDEEPARESPGPTDPGPQPKPDDPEAYPASVEDGWSELGDGSGSTGVWEWSETREVQSFEEIAPEPEMPRTGLRNILALWINGACISLISLVVILFFVYRSKKTERQARVNTRTDRTGDCSD